MIKVSCRNVCTLGVGGSVCQGCGRTKTQVLNWHGMDTRLKRDAAILIKRHSQLIAGIRKYVNAETTDMELQLLVTECKTVSKFEVFFERLIGEIATWRFVDEVFVRAPVNSTADTILKQIYDGLPYGRPIRHIALPGEHNVLDLNAGPVDTITPYV